MKIHLKMKICSLAEEARIIRRMEKRIVKRRRHWAKKTDTSVDMRSEPMRLSLQQHRQFVVRLEARNSNLAYGFLRGRTYKQVEDRHRPVDKQRSRPASWSRVADLVAKYGNMDKRIAAQKLAEWTATE